MKSILVGDLTKDVFGYDPVENLEIDFDWVSNASTWAFDEWLEENAEDPEDPTEEEFEGAEEARMEAESRLIGDMTTVVRHEVENYLEELLGHHEIDVDFTDGMAVLSCKDWNRSADLLIDTINGEGTFEYDSVEEFIEVVSPDGSAKGAVLSHLHWIGSWQEVYEGGTAKGQIERRIDRALRNL